jgi:hypothetical protein
MAGNSNSGRKQEKPFRDALRMEIAEAGNHPHALRNIARQLIMAAEEGKMDAIKEFADRIDGKVPQAVQGDSENPLELVHRIERHIVETNPKD